MSGLDPRLRRLVVAAALLLPIAVVTGCGGGNGPGDEGAERPPAAEAPSRDPSPADPMIPADTLGAGTYVFTCPDGFAFAADVDTGSARVELVVREETLPRVPSATGARYEAGDLVFWSHGGAALLAAGDREHRECRGVAASSPWEKAALLGIEFRALGQEPGWILDVHPERWIRYIGDYGETRMALPPVSPEEAGDTLTYRTSTEEHTLTAVVRPVPCRDAMSGHAFSHTVTVRVDGRELEGCGRRLQAP